MSWAGRAISWRALCRTASSSSEALTTGSDRMRDRVRWPVTPATSRWRVTLWSASSPASASPTASGLPTSPWVMWAGGSSTACQAMTCSPRAISMRMECPSKGNVSRFLAMGSSLLRRRRGGSRAGQDHIEIAAQIGGGQAEPVHRQGGQPGQLQIAHEAEASGQFRGGPQRIAGGGQEPYRGLQYGGGAALDALQLHLVQAGQGEAAPEQVEGLSQVGEAGPQFGHPSFLLH